jgi:predicted transcriptional regulator
MDVANRPPWTFLTNHAHALLYLAQHPDARLRDIADAVGITERFTHTVVGDLIDAGYLTASKQGRRNTYQVNDELTFRHPLEQAAHISSLLEIFAVQKEEQELRDSVAPLDLSSSES